MHSTQEHIHTKKNPPRFNYTYQCNKFWIKLCGQNSTVIKFMAIVSDGMWSGKIVRKVYTPNYRILIYFFGEVER